jgi:hypothetical protein
MYGVVTISSTVRGVNIENGMFELVSEAGAVDASFYLDRPEPVSEAEAVGQHIYDPWVYTFSFMKADKR